MEQNKIDAPAVDAAKLDDLGKLKALAEAAKGVEWTIEYPAVADEWEPTYTLSLGEDIVDDRAYYPSAPLIENARFIAAANPAAILRIAALVAQQAARIADLERELRNADAIITKLQSDIKEDKCGECGGRAVSKGYEQNLIRCTECGFTAAPAVPAVDALTDERSMMDAAWDAYQNAPFDHAEDSDAETRKCVEAAVRAALADPADPEQAKLDSLAALPVARQPQAAPVLGYISDDAMAMLKCGRSMTSEQTGPQSHEERLATIRNSGDKQLIQGVLSGSISIHAASKAGEQMGGAQVAQDREQRARELDDRYRKGYSEGWAEGRSNLAESAAAPADLSNGAVWGAIDAAMPLLAQHHCPALLALSKGDKEIFAHAILATNRATEGEATERKPLTDAEIWKLAPRHSTAADGIDPVTYARAIEQHHGIGGGK